MPGPARLLGQALVYAAVAALVGWLSSRPVYTYLAPDRALVRVSFSHAGARRGECRRLSPEEIAKLAPNMRRPADCPRERVPVVVEIAIDGRVVWHASLPPSGLAKDGPSNAYARFEVPAGRHRIVARLRDTARASGFDYERAAVVDLPPGRNLAIDFSVPEGGFRFLGARAAPGSRRWS